MAKAQSEGDKAVTAEEAQAAEAAKVEADEAEAERSKQAMSKMTEPIVTHDEAQEAGYYGSVSEESKRQQKEASIPAKGGE